MKGIYLASFQASHNNYNIEYQDINGKRDIAGDMLDVDLVKYDFIIATPPCNYWSRANYRRDISIYALQTKNLLPKILKKLSKQDKPYIVENVKNRKLFKMYDLYNLSDYVYEIGRHTYWTNIPFNYGKKQSNDNIQNITKSKRQGSGNVHDVIETWLSQL